MNDAHGMNDAHANLALETTYWGVRCRTCTDLLVFDTFPCNTFGIATATRRPGAIRCARGHNHIYFPHDFRFVPSAIEIDEATMALNRREYQAINPACRLQPFERVGQMARPA